MLNDMLDNVSTQKKKKLFKNKKNVFIFNIRLIIDNYDKENS